jgi:hypothetical protein
MVPEAEHGGVVTVTAQLALMLVPSVEVAVMVAFPILTPLTTPELLTVATALFEDAQFNVLLLAFAGSTVAVS